MVDTGSSQDLLSKTGLAHMMEHMAFKGTPDIGTTNYAEEKVALAKVEQAYAAYEADAHQAYRERSAEAGAVTERVARRHQGGRQVCVEEPVRRDRGKPRWRRHERVYNYDETGYMYSMPSNMIELWAAIESDRFANPVMREFYKERNVVMEERRMRTDSDPTAG
jgi:predicted Zn-dependent peptidase